MLLPKGVSTSQLLPAGGAAESLVEAFERTRYVVLFAIARGNHPNVTAVALYAVLVKQAVLGHSLCSILPWSTPQIVQRMNRQDNHSVG